MSREAVAAALARLDLSAGERLVAFSLASFADRENRARPGTPSAAARAGLERSGFLEARDRLERRGLVVVEVAASGRGKASTLALPFASQGPWWDGDINAELFEAVLGYSRSQGSARLLVAAISALADERGVVDRLTTEDLCAAAGISDRTYRRVSGPLLASGELVLHSSAGGRGNTNRWEVADPRSQAPAAAPGSRRRRVAPPPDVRPLVATVARPVDEQLPIALPECPDGERTDPVAGTVKGGQDRTVSPQNRPRLSGVSGEKGCQARTVSAQNRPDLSGVSVLNPCQDRTLSPETPAETPAKNPAETPAPYARASNEPQNPRTPEDPPSPPEGGNGADQLVVEETYVTERGRKRRRSVTVDLAAVRERLRAAGEADLGAWEQVRGLLLEAVGESTFEIWLANLELIAVDVDGALVVSASQETVGWVRQRFRRLLDRAAQRSARSLRIADEVEHKAAERLTSTSAVPPDILPVGAGSGGHVRSDGRPGGVHADLSVDVRAGRSGDSPAARSPRRADSARADTSAYPRSYTDVYNQAKEVSR